MIIALIVYTMTMEKTRDIATLKIIGASDWKIGGLILQEALTLGLLGYGLGAILITFTYEYFPRRVAILPFDQYVLLGIVIIICVLASLLGIRRALGIDPTTASGEGPDAGDRGGTSRQGIRRGETQVVGLQDASAAVAAGGWGADGAERSGKTTLLRALSLIDPPTTGSVAISDAVIYENGQVWSTTGACGGSGWGSSSRPTT